MTGRWEAIERIFHAALEKPASERNAFVSAEAGDGQLAREVLSLLDAESGDSIPPRPALAGLMEALDGAFLTGRKIGAYRVGDLLGEGGMGIVYEAADERDGARVALKLLPPDQARFPRRVARFLSEGRALAALHHPSVVSIREAGADQGVRYLAMERLEGETLRQRLARAGPLDVSEAIAAGCAIAAALDAAHRAGVTHRDLKPENVMLTPAGVKVFDFGLAHLDEGEDAQRTTLDSALAGTVSYLAPEQIEGSSGTPRSDMFSLGVVLYEAVTGASPFQRANAIATAHAILRDSPDFRAVPVRLRPVVKRCLAKDPRRRYSSAGELAVALEQGRGQQPLLPSMRWTVASAAAIALCTAWWFLRAPPFLAQSLAVPAATDIWLAGQPAGSTLTGNYGQDRAPGESPVEIRVTPGHTLTFSASGRTTVDGLCFADTPDGGCYPDESRFGSGPANGISAIRVPSNALIGVFLDGEAPSGESPEALDFVGEKRAFTSLAPHLRQIFFIGDGRTGTNAGARQRFLVPAGATRLFLAISDSLGSSAGNAGQVRVSIADITGSQK